MLSLLRAAGARKNGSSSDPVRDEEVRAGPAASRRGGGRVDARAAAAGEDGGKDGGAKNEEGDENKNKKVRQRFVPDGARGFDAGHGRGSQEQQAHRGREKGRGKMGPRRTSTSGVPERAQPVASLERRVGEPPSRSGRFARALFAAAVERRLGTAARRRPGWSCARAVVARRRPPKRTRGSSRAGRRARAGRGRRARRRGARNRTSCWEREARALRMNTEARRAIFCVVMGSEDFADALERLQKLPLAGAGPRDLPRADRTLPAARRTTRTAQTLASKLCERFPRPQAHVTAVRVGSDARGGVRGSRGSRRVSEAFPKDKGARVRRIANLARFVAGALLSGAMAPAALKGCFERRRRVRVGFSGGASRRLAGARSGACCCRRC